MKTTESGSPADYTNPLLTLHRPGGTRASVSMQGGQVLSWTHRGRERLFTSPLAVFEPGQATRGGIPVIFPQFGDRGPGLRHGFARLFEWQTTGTTADRLNLRLSYSDASLRLWPHRFLADLEVQLVDEGLSTSLSIANCGDAEFQFTAALHTYLKVSQLDQVAVIGLHQRPYLNATTGRTEIHSEKLLRFAGEVDRVYANSGDIHLVLQDGHQQLEILSDGFADSVIWNPGAERASTIADLGRENYANFVCVEAANVEKPVLLSGGATWRGSQTLICRDGERAGVSSGSVPDVSAFHRLLG